MLPHLELVIAGVVRVFVTAPDGRTMTIRYCRPGAIIGAVSLFATGFALPATTQALVDAELLRLSPTTARRAAARDVRVAQAFLSELSGRDPS
jgi:CRP/FNR family transcriptional regulator